MKKALNFLIMRQMQNQKKKVHHFRTWNVEREIIYLQTCWKNCFTDPSCIPAKDVTGLNGKVHRINNISFLMDNVEDNTTLSLETNEQYLSQKRLKRDEEINISEVNMQAGVTPLVHTEIQKTVIQQEPVIKKSLTVTEAKKMEEVDFNVEKMHTVPIIRQ